MAENNWHSRSCPNCGSNELDPKVVARAKHPAEDLDWDIVKEAFVGLRADQIFFTFRRCAVCRLAYSPTYFSNSQLDLLYKSMPDNTMGNSEATATATQGRYADFICEHAGPADNYLELGPDRGFVLRRLIDRGFKGQAFLVEPNTEMHEVLRGFNKLLSGVTVDSAIETLPISNQIDTTAAIHVIDHLIRPFETLNLIADLSSENSSLVIVVHNEKSLLRKLLDLRWPPFCLQHPQIFDKHTLRNLLSRTGWELQQIKPTWNYYDVGNLFETLTHLFGLKLKWSALNKMRIALPLGNFIIHATKKI